MVQIRLGDSGTNFSSIPNGGFQGTSADFLKVSRHSLRSVCEELPEDVKAPTYLIHKVLHENRV